MLRIHLISIVVVTGFFVAVCRESNELPTLQTVDSGIQRTDSLSYERAAHSSTKLFDGRVLVAGGMRANGEFHDTAEVFDTKTGNFKTLPSLMTKRRVSHTATRLNDGRVLITGGWSNRKTPEDSTEIFDPKTGRFASGAPMAFRRSGHTATLLENGNVLIAGGQDGDRIHKAVELFEADSGKFRLLGQMGSPRKIHTATKLNNGRVLLAGGEVTDNNVVSTAEVFDPKKGISEKLAERMSSARYKHDALKLKDGRVLIYGGSDARDTRGRLRTAELFDPEKKTFSRVGDLSIARFKINGTSVLLDNGKVLIAGGADRAELFDPAKGEFSLVNGSYGNSFHFASATLLDDGRALIVGGYRFRARARPLATNGAWIFEG